jgi:hypothetical protein
MTPYFFLSTYDRFKSICLIRSQKEFAAMLGVGEQWLNGLARKDRFQRRVRAKHVLRLEARLNEFERTAPRPLKPVFIDLQNRLRLAEAYTTGDFRAMYETSRAER